jgi:superfamily I DNA and/or RNA helicase
MNNAVTPAIQQRIKTWKDRLADLSKRNRLLYFKKDKPPTVEISNPESVSILFEALTGEKPRPLPADELETRQMGTERTKFLKKLRKEANALLKEKGVNSLFVAIGTLTWNVAEKSKELISSPILLIPVELRKTSRKEEYTLYSTEEEVSLNPVLVQKLSTEFGITLPEIEIERNLGYDELLNGVRQAVADRLNWNVEITAYISLFQRTKAAMIRDIERLEQNEEIVAKHPILQALAGNWTAYESSIPQKIDARELDERVDPESVFQILEADSSQQEVIEAAKAGHSFVVQGPPGTGKSQTIVNMIAELMGTKKRVLLVSEKETALEVVFNRLKDCGLDDACLNLHHRATTNKKDFYEHLNKTASQLLQRHVLQEQSSLFHELRRCRQTLHDHPVRLHQKQQPLNKSAFELYGELLRLERAKIPIVEFTLSNVKEWSDLQLLDAKELLRNLSGFLRFFRGEQTTVWTRSQLKDFPFEVRSEFSGGIENLRRGVQIAERASVRLDELLGGETSSTLAELEALYSAVGHVMAVPLVPAGWPRGTDVRTLHQLFSDLEWEVEAIQTNPLRTKYSSAILDLNLPALLERYQKYKGTFRFLRCAYWQDRRNILKCRTVKDQVSDEELISDLKQAVRLQELRNRLRDPAHPARVAFRPFFSTEQPDLDSIRRALDWLIELRKDLNTEKVAAAISSLDSRRELERLQDELETTQNQIEAGFQFLLNYFPQEFIDSLKTQSLEEVRGFLNTAENELDLFEDWLTYQNLIEQIEALGAGTFLSKLRDSEISPESWYPILEKGVYENRLKYIHSNNPNLRNFHSHLHEQVVREFSELDSRQYEVARERLRQLHAECWREWSRQSTAKQQMQLLQQQSGKQKKKEIRQFITSAPELVTTLKPCWLMSPLAVSQYIDPQVVHFDVVIFDEASQIRTEEAIPSIMRAKQVIIVGDNKQLPPTSFFVGTSSDEEDDEDEDIYESVLDECWTFMENHILMWHYRSQDESLIAFSNQKVYESQLISFPNPVKDANRGVHFRYVEGGIYDRGGRRDNIREAEEVARLTLEHVQQNPHQSLGIIAFSKAQADAIEEQLDQLSATNPNLAEFCQDDSPNFFLKPLERVQGDERDVIILSFGYGFDSQGELIHNFGPLSRQGGERRLNVAITRAKYKLVLVASIQADNLDLSRTNSRGVALLKDYLTYAASNGKNMEGNRSDDLTRFNSPLEDDIYQALSERNYQVERRVGCSDYRIDLAVRNDQQDEFLLGIECDGVTYHRYSTVRDRDRLRRLVLEKLGWRIHRIWSREWFRDRNNQIEQLVERLEHLRLQN